MGSVEQILALKDFSDSCFRIEFGSIRWRRRVLKFIMKQKGRLFLPLGGFLGVGVAYLRATPAVKNRIRCRDLFRNRPECAGDYLMRDASRAVRGSLDASAPFTQIRE